MTNSGKKVEDCEAVEMAHAAGIDGEVQSNQEELASGEQSGGEGKGYTAAAEVTEVMKGTGVKLAGDEAENMIVNFSGTEELIVDVEAGYRCGRQAGHGELGRGAKGRGGRRGRRPLSRQPRGEGDFAERAADG